MQSVAALVRNTVRHRHRLTEFTENSWCVSILCSSQLGLHEDFVQVLVQRKALSFWGELRPQTPWPVVLPLDPAGDRVPRTPENSPTASHFPKLEVSGIDTGLQ